MAREMVRRHALQVGELTDDGYRIIVSDGGRYFVELWGTEGRTRGQLIATYGTWDALRAPERARLGWATIQTARRFILDNQHATWEDAMEAICADCHHSAAMWLSGHFPNCACWCHLPEHIPVEPI